MRDRAERYRTMPAAPIRADDRTIGVPSFLSQPEPNQRRPAMFPTALDQQLAFLREIDRLKNVIRQSRCWIAAGRRTVPSTRGTLRCMH